MFNHTLHSVDYPFTGRDCFPASSALGRGERGKGQGTHLDIEGNVYGDALLSDLVQEDSSVQALDDALVLAYQFPHVCYHHAH